MATFTMMGASLHPKGYTDAFTIDKIIFIILQNLVSAKKRNRAVNPLCSVIRFNRLNIAVNIRFENGILKCITGTSYDTFIMDKTIDNVWDGDFVSSLTAMGIQFKLLS